MKIFIKDVCFAHCIYSNNPLPPIQFSEDIEWDRSNNFTNDDLIIYTDNEIYNSRNIGKNIAWLIEPKELQPSLYNFVSSNYSKFHKIFTHDVEMLKLPNSILIPYGGCWIKKEDFSIHKKTKNISIICSNKNYLSGHKLRHECIKKFKQYIDVYGNGYNPINYKFKALQEYRFQIVIENTKKDFWFTEKLIDCFMTGTVPIYYGCPSISKFFNTQGMIVFDNLIELDEIIKNLDEIKYNSMLDYIEENYKKANNYILAEKSISQIIQNI